MIKWKFNSNHHGEKRVRLIGTQGPKKHFVFFLLFLPFLFLTTTKTNIIQISIVVIFIFSYNILTTCLKYIIAIWNVCIGIRSFVYLYFYTVEIYGDIFKFINGIK